MFTHILGDGYQHSVVLQLKHILEASFVQVPRERDFRRQFCYKVGHVQQSGLPTLWSGFSVEICNNGKAFPSIRVEDLNYFRDIATEILIGLFDASLHQYLFLYRGFHQFQFVTGLVGENCGHYLRITDDGGNHPRN